MRRVAARLLALLLAGTLLGALPSASPTASAKPGDEKWKTRVFSLVPSPGYPAYVHKHTNGRVYAASYVAGDRQRSRVFEWGRGAGPARSRSPTRRGTDAWSCSRRRAAA